MNITTTQFGTQSIFLTYHKFKKGLNNIVESIIDEMKEQSGVTRVTSEERTVLHKEIRSQLID